MKVQIEQTNISLSELGDKALLIRHEDRVLIKKAMQNCIEQIHCMYLELSTSTEIPDSLATLYAKDILKYQNIIDLL